MDTVSTATIAADNYRVVPLTDAPQHVEAIADVVASRWMPWMLAGRPGHRVDIPRLCLEQCPAHQVVAVDDRDQLVGAGLSAPLAWDGTVDGLPAGWDGALTAAEDLVASGRTPDAVSAISITLRPGITGTDLSARMILALKAAAARVGARALIAPVRPVLKSRYPLIPIEQYVAWRTPDGEVFDPWLRRHITVGGRQLAIAYPSMTVTGSADEWQEWTGLALPGNGDYVIAGGLTPLVIDRAANTGIYREPNVWIEHPIA